jgi:hypothetical protein
MSSLVIPNSCLPCCGRKSVVSPQSIGRGIGRYLRERRVYWTYLGEPFLQPTNHNVQLDSPTAVSLRIKERLAMRQTICRASSHISVCQSFEVLLVDEDVHRSVEVTEKIVEVGEVPVPAVAEESVGVQRGSLRASAELTVPLAPRSSCTALEKEGFGSSSTAQRGDPAQDCLRCECGARTVIGRQISVRTRRDNGQKANFRQRAKEGNGCDR